MNTEKDNITNDAVKPAGNIRKYIHISILLISITIMVLFVIYLSKLENLSEGFENYGLIGVFLMGLIGSSAPVWPVPGSVAALIAGGLGWNPVYIALAAGIGEAIGEWVGYMAGFGTQIAVEKISFYPRIAGWMRRRGSIVVFIVSAVPNHFVKIVGAAAGALHYPAWKYFLASCSGKILKSFAFALIGGALAPLISRILEGQYSLWIILIIGVCIAAVIGGAVAWYIRRTKKSKE